MLTRASLAVLAFLAPTAALAVSIARGPVITRVAGGEAVIAWETDGSQSGAQVSYGTTSSHGQTAADPGSGENHNVRLTGLAPSTTYHYAIDSDPGVDNTFSTPPAAPGDAPISFLVYGDNRTNQGDHQSVVDQMRKETGISFLLQTGDMAQNYPGIGSLGQEWDQFFQVERDLLRNAPLVPTIGNHETLDLLTHWNEFFSTSKATYYSTDWGQIHLAVLDTFEGNAISDIEGKDAISDAQVMWLDADLAQAQAAHQLLFVALHHGAFSNAIGSGAHGPSTLVQQKILPIALGRGVVAMFAGHDHIYERGCNQGMDYFVVGGGGAPLYDVNAAGIGVVTAKKSLSYVRVDVQGRAVTGHAYDSSGAKLDTFALPSYYPGCGQQPDGGVDAGPPDGGDPDAGADAGLPDAGPVDAGAADAGSGPADAGVAQDAGASGDGADAGDGPTPAPAGCQSAGPLTLAWLLVPLGLLFLRRRRPAGR